MKTYKTGKTRVLSTEIVNGEVRIIISTIGVEWLTSEITSAKAYVKEVSDNREGLGEASVRMHAGAQARVNALEECLVHLEPASESEDVTKWREAALSANRLVGYAQSVKAPDQSGDGNSVTIPFRWFEGLIELAKLVGVKIDAALQNKSEESTTKERV